jgi:DNA-binding transcriptional ArsR family regulator
MSITSPTARALAALGHDTRLAIFRLLVRAGEEGLNVGEIGQHLDQAPSTLAHHLSALVEAGLVVQECCTGVKLAKTETAA